MIRGCEVSSAQRSEEGLSRGGQDIHDHKLTGYLLVGPGQALP